MGPSRPRMPKSTAVSWAGAAMNRLPSCRSAWNRPWLSAWLRNPRVRATARAGRSRVSSARAPGSESAVPLAQVRVRARRPTPSQTTAGPVMKPSLAMMAASSSAPAASKRRSSSRFNARITVPAKAASSSRRVVGISRSAIRAASNRTALSCATSCSMPGRSTFTATGVPSIRVALCACAIEAAATAGPSSANTASIGLPRAASTAARACAWGKGARRSFRCDRSSAKGSPKISARVAKN